MSKQCPGCGLHDPPSTRRCDCGYDFVAKRMVAREGKPGPRGGWGGLSACFGLLLLAAAVRLAIPSEHVHGDVSLWVAVLASPLLLLLTCVFVYLWRRERPKHRD